MLALTVAGPKVVGAGSRWVVGLEDVGVAGGMDEGKEVGDVIAGVGLEVGVAEACKQSP